MFKYLPHIICTFHTITIRDFECIVPAGATFQRLINVVMSGLHFEVCLVYLDDIVLYSRTTEEHLERLVRVLGL